MIYVHSISGRDSFFLTTWNLSFNNIYFLFVFHYWINLWGPLKSQLKAFLPFLPLMESENKRSFSFLLKAYSESTSFSSPKWINLEFSPTFFFLAFRFILPPKDSLRTGNILLLWDKLFSIMQDFVLIPHVTLHRVFYSSFFSLFFSINLTDTVFELRRKERGNTYIPTIVLSWFSNIISFNVQHTLLRLTLIFTFWGWGHWVLDKVT